MHGLDVSSRSLSALGVLALSAALLPVAAPAADAPPFRPARQAETVTIDLPGGSDLVIVADALTMDGTQRDAQIAELSVDAPLRIRNSRGFDLKMERGRVAVLEVRQNGPVRLYVEPAK